MVTKLISCETCQNALVSTRFEPETNSAFALLNRKRWGKLIDASSDLILVCIESEKLFVALSKQEKFSSLASIAAKISQIVLKMLFQKSN